MIVIPMAGLSRRFTEAGYDRPKYMLPLRGKSLFAQVMEGFRGYFSTETFLIVYRDIAGTRAFLEAELKALGLPPARAHLVELSAATRGQAETVALGLRQANVPADEPLTIFNIDTLRPGFTHPDGLDLAAIDGYLEVFPGPGEHWSFVRPDPADPEACRVLEVTEKRRISNLCSSGLYYFRTAQSFLALFAEIEGQDPQTLEGGEFYIAPMYRRLIERGGDVRYAQIAPQDVKFSGTPAEYDALLRETPSDRRIAFCISGQLRGPRSHLTEIAALAERMDADIYISSWRKRGRKTLAGARAPGKKARILGLPAMLYFLRGSLDEIFPAVEENLARLPAERAEPDLRTAFPGAVIEVEDEALDLSLETEFPDKNSLRMLYKIWRCNRLKRAGEAQRGAKYDLVLRFRPDILPDLPSGVRPGSGQVIVPEFAGEGLNDQFWFCSSRADDRLSGLFGRAVQAPMRRWDFIHRELPDWLSAQGLEARPEPIGTRLSEGFDPDDQRIARGLVADALEAGQFRPSPDLTPHLAPFLAALLRLEATQTALPLLIARDFTEAPLSELFVALVALAFHDAPALLPEDREKLLRFAQLCVLGVNAIARPFAADDPRLRRIERLLGPVIRQAGPLPASERCAKAAQVFHRLEQHLEAAYGPAMAQDLSDLRRPAPAS